MKVFDRSKSITIFNTLFSDMVLSWLGLAEQSI